MTERQHPTALGTALLIEDEATRTAIMRIARGREWMQSEAALKALQTNVAALNKQVLDVVLPRVDLRLVRSTALAVGAPSFQPDQRVLDDVSAMLADPEAQAELANNLQSPEYLIEAYDELLGDGGSSGGDSGEASYAVGDEPPALDASIVGVVPAPTGSFTLEVSEEPEPEAEAVELAQWFRGPKDALELLGVFAGLAGLFWLALDGPSLAIYGSAGIVAIWLFAAGILKAVRSYRDRRRS